MIPSKLSHLPEFKGSDLSEERLDGIMLYAFQKSDLENMRSHFDKKWWDYRFIHPGHALYLFVHYYKETAEKWRSKFGLSVYAKIDHLMNPVWRIKRGETSLTPTSSRTGWIRAMMFADEYGVPYEKWIAFAFEFAFENKWQKMPLPTSLYGDKMVMYILEKWSEECKALTTLPTDSKYKAENFVGHVYQIQFQDWLMKQIVAKSHPVYAIRHYLKNDTFLIEEHARAKFGDILVNQAIR